MSHLLTPKTSHISFEISKDLLLIFLWLVLHFQFLGIRLYGLALSFQHFLNEIGCLCFSIDIWTYDLVGMYNTRVGFPMQNVVAFDRQYSRFMMYFVHEILYDVKFVLGG